MIQTVAGKNLSAIGIGTYGLGGRGHRDMPITEKQEDGVYVEALKYSLDSGCNFTEISLGYGHGASIRLFKEALDKSSLDRQNVFITHSLYPHDFQSADDIYRDIADFYKIMETGYADSILVTQSLIQIFGEDMIYSMLHELLNSDKTRFVSLSNAGPAWIRKFKDEFGDKFFAHEGHLSFEVRSLQDKAVFDLCDDLEVKNIIWRPLRRSKTEGHNWSLLKELSAKYEKTQSQIILNWICSLGYRPMVFSTSKEHIRENLSSVDFQMEQKDLKLMTDFRASDYAKSIDWDSPKIDDDIVALANQ